jgi:hypothetical protein
MPFTADEAVFVAALSEADDLGCVIRLTIVVEGILIGMIEQVVPNPKELEKLNLDYHGRVSLAVALGMPVEIAPALRALGKLRNRFAHRLEAKLEVGEVTDLYNTLPPDQRTYLHHFLKTMGAEGVITKAQLSSLPPRQQLSLIAISLRRYLLNGFAIKRGLLGEGQRSN